MSGFLWGGVVLWHLWVGSAGHLGPGSAPFLIEVLNVGEWLTHGDFALDVEVDFLAVVEHRLILARVRSERARLRCKRLASIWALASQDASHVGILCLAKGIMAGLWVDLEGSWAFASFMVGCPRAAAAVSRCEVMRDRWVVPHFAVRTCFDYSRWLAKVSLPVQRMILWPASWLPVLDKGRGSNAAEVQRVWDIYDDRLQFMSRDDALSLDGALDCGDVSLAWTIWSSAFEAALADAYRFAGGLVPDRGLVLGRGVFCLRTVRLGDPEVRRARKNISDSQEGSDVSLYHDVSTAPLLDLRRRLKAVVDLLAAMIRGGVSLARSVELVVQWDGILRIGSIHPIIA